MANGGKKFRREENKRRDNKGARRRRERPRDARGKNRTNGKRRAREETRGKALWIKLKAAAATPAFVESAIFEIGQSAVIIINPVSSVRCVNTYQKLETEPVVAKQRERERGNS